MSDSLYLTDYGQVPGGLVPGTWRRTIEGFYGSRCPSVLGDAQAIGTNRLRAMNFHQFSDPAPPAGVSTHLIADLREADVVRLWRAGAMDADGTPLLEVRFAQPHPASWISAARHEGGLAFILGWPNEVTAPLPEDTTELWARATRVWYLEVPVRFF